VLLPFLRVSEVSLACRAAPRLRLVWKRGGSPLAPGVGEGVSKLTWCLAGVIGHGESLQSFVVDLMMNQIDQSSGACRLRKLA